jgi:hypothetical protein
MKLNNIDKRVDKYIAGLPDWQQRICQIVRSLIHAADPKVIETIKRTDRPYFILKGNICALQGTKTHVNIFIYNPIVPDPQGLINQGKENLTAQSIQVFENDKIDESALLELFKAIIINNRAGGWRKIVKSK